MNRGRHLRSDFKCGVQIWGSPEATLQGWVHGCPDGTAEGVGEVGRVMESPQDTVGVRGVSVHREGVLQERGRHFATPHLLGHPNCISDSEQT